MVRTRITVRKMLPVFVMAMVISLPVSQSSVMASTNALSHAEWKAILKAHHPNRPGCFVAKFPVAEWIQDACGAPVSTSQNVGSGHDATGSDASVSIGKVDGGFISVSGITSESDGYNHCSSHSTGQNYYTIQENTNSYYINASVTGAWVQFIFENDPCGNQGKVYIEYWLFGYGAACPTGQSLTWNHPLNSNIDCFANGPTQYTGEIDPTNSLFLDSSVSLTGTANSGGSDSVELYDIGNGWYAYGPDSTVKLSAYWHNVEWNVFGDCCSNTATFNPGTSMALKVNMWDSAGSQITPTCADQSQTAEQNNMNLGSPYCTPSTGYYSFSESI
jgi:hypothetical protein